MPVAAGLYYARFEGEENTHKPVVLIHGAGSSHLCWPAQLRRLKGCTVLALDLPGHGRSSGIGLQSVEAYSAAVIEFLAELGLFRAVFVGHSLGGAVALQLALDFPQHTAGIGLISTGAYFNVSMDLIHYLSSAAGYHAGMQYIQKLSFAAGASLEMIERSMSAIASARPSVLCGDWTACSQFDLRQRVSQINVPAYIACGLEDRLAPPAFSQFLASTLPDARLELLAEAGHMAILEQPQKLACSLADFLAALDRQDDPISLPISIPAAQRSSTRLRNGKQGE